MQMWPWNVKAHEKHSQIFSFLFIFFYSRTTWSILWWKPWNNGDLGNDFWLDSGISPFIANPGPLWALWNLVKEAKSFNSFNTQSLDLIN